MPSRAKKSSLVAATLASVGVVYGDIGTSPLYAFKESLRALGENGLAPEAILGILSLITWALFIIVTLKYVVILLRADNQGEGGILSLMALIQHHIQNHKAWIFALGMIGAAMFYGDAIITPAISVLSAVEGLKLVAPHISHLIIPISLVIIAGLFIVQTHGTEKIAWCFGPIMALWFVVLALGGLPHIAAHPGVWHALNPAFGIHFLLTHGKSAIIALGAVFLAVTGAEALYADLGHFGKRPIRLAWLVLVLPALLLNYFGQAALVLAHPEAAGDSFYLLYPQWALLPMVILSTIATIIASQAVISGAYSMTYQAIQLGLLPRLNVRYTSMKHYGQIYIPEVNWLLLGGVILLIGMFHTSSNLASAYGIAVTTTMVITGILMLIAMRRLWHWPLYLTLLLMLPLICIDLVFLGGNLLKVFEGGFIPLLVAGLLIAMMYTWRAGTEVLNKQFANKKHTLEYLLQCVAEQTPTRIPGTAVYLSKDTQYIPSALLQNLEHYNVLHEHVVLLTLRFSNTPYIPTAQRLEIKHLAEDFTQVTMLFGFMQSPNIPKALQLLHRQQPALPLKKVSYFVSRRHILASATFGLPLWQDRLFIAMANNTGDTADFFSLPRNCVVELGVQVKI